MRLSPLSMEAAVFVPVIITIIIIYISHLKKILVCVCK